MILQAILRAISEKLIPGISLNTRISILQQTAVDQASREGESLVELSNKPVLQQVIEGDTFRNEAFREHNGKSMEIPRCSLRTCATGDTLMMSTGIVLLEGINDGTDPLSPVRAFRQIRRERLQKELFEVQKAAKLRSGARGFDARKMLIAYEKRFEESVAAYVKWTICTQNEHTVLKLILLCPE